MEWRSLREIEVGICDGLSYEQIKTKFPEEYRARFLKIFLNQKFNH